ncbi:hypothetical protein BJ322DRAFT_1107611 [Thelephora terrestris]|uniref:Uncharacterized protein n=1 Tax=Thelephora terrestris TaxID=56493 RepID=A0A9P6HEQ2_9AGAM|nr:hypothetical protein BJ322DRAFT_1107611 [Thelephora terrestris]
MYPQPTAPRGGHFFFQSDPSPQRQLLATSSSTFTSHTQHYYAPAGFFTFHPALGNIWVAFSDGRVYTWATEEVPQKPYNCGNTQNSWEKHLPILFSTRLSPGVRLLDAFRGNFEGIDDRDTFPLGTDTRGMSIRIHLLGYPSSTDVEKELKKLADRGGKDKVKKSKARSMQVSTKNYKAEAEPVTKSKLAQEVAKRVLWHIEDLKNNSDLFPFDDRVGGKWRLGEGFMRFENMTITALEKVSKGSWSPVIHIDKIL